MITPSILHYLSLWPISIFYHLGTTLHAQTARDKPHPLAGDRTAALPTKSSLISKVKECSLNGEMVSNIADLFLNEVQLPHVCMYEYRDGDADFQTASLPAKTS